MIYVLTMLFGLGAVDASHGYLCDVYKRMPEKRDAAGDFTWKDIAAAERMKMDLCEYVVGGMNPKLKSALVEFGKLSDETGMAWSFSSGFRDDFRQSLASGIKARPGYSLHGGSKVTRGYGDGRAVDLTTTGPIGALLKLLDLVGTHLGLIRPFRSFDPAHIQLKEKTR